MTRIAFIANHLSFHEIFEVPILAGIAKQDGHQTLLVDYGASPGKALDRVKSFAPDVLAYTAMSCDKPVFLEINRAMKQTTGALSLFGGALPTFEPDFIAEDGIDAICLGEGDLAFRDLINNFATERMYETPNLHFKLGDGEIIKNPPGNLVADLDTLPHPDRELLMAESYLIRALPMKTFFAGRGCPFRCSYCFNETYNRMFKDKGKILRVKSVDYLLGEIKAVIRRYPTSFIKFHDDVFGVHKGWLEEFAERYRREIGLPFLVYARPNMISEDYCRLLRLAGCHSVGTAIECGNDRIRNDVLRRNMRNAQIITAARGLKENGIKICALNMIGIPGEGEAELRETLELNRACGVDFADVGILQPYPGTDLTRYCIEQGYLKPGAENWAPQFTASILEFPEDFKRSLIAWQGLFALLVDRRGSEWLLGLARILAKTGFGRRLLGYFYRIYYGLFMQSRIYPMRIGWLFRLRIGLTVLMSRNRV